MSDYSEFMTGERFFAGVAVGGFAVVLAVEAGAPPTWVPLGVLTVCAVAPMILHVYR